MADRLNDEHAPAPGPGELVRATDEGAARPPLSATVSRLETGVGHRDLASPHSAKFRVATVALAAIAAGALLLAGLLLSQGRGHSSSFTWSSWSPTDSGRAAENEIAQHVAPLYRGTPPADQLDVVTLMNIANPSAGGTTAGGGLNVAVNQTGSGGLALLGGHTVAYNICGVGGTGCQLGGTPSANRLLLLRREALELALYTFRYISSADNVVVILPPGRTQTTSTLSSKPPSPGAAVSGIQPVTIAVVFIRQELQPWLNQPLAATLQEFPPAASQLTLWKQTQEANVVDQITGHALFSEKIEQAQDGSTLLVLNQLPPQ